MIPFAERMGAVKPSGQLAGVLKMIEDLSSGFAGTLGAKPPNIKGARAIIKNWANHLTLGNAPIPVEPLNLGSLPAFWICDAAADMDRRLLYLHGGAYIMGDSQTYFPMLSRLSKASGCVILAIDYRLAPEHPFPAALEDAVSAYQFLIDNGPRGSGKAKRLYIAGDSAGGGLTLATAYQLRDKGMQMPHGLAPICPWMDVFLKANEDKLDDDIKKTARNNAAMYMGKERFDHPLISPLYGNPAGLPPILLQTGEADPSTLFDSADFMQKARRAGVAVNLEAWRNMPHVWQAFVPILPEAEQAIDAIGNWLKQR